MKFLNHETKSSPVLGDQAGLSSYFHLWVSCWKILGNVLYRGLNYEKLMKLHRKYSPDINIFIAKFILNHKNDNTGSEQRFIQDKFPFLSIPRLGDLNRQ